MYISYKNLKMYRLGDESKGDREANDREDKLKDRLNIVQQKISTVKDELNDKIDILARLMDTKKEEEDFENFMPGHPMLDIEKNGIEGVCPFSNLIPIPIYSHPISLSSLSFQPFLLFNNLFLSLHLFHICSLFLSLLLFSTPPFVILRFIFHLSNLNKIKK